MQLRPEFVKAVLLVAELSSPFRRRFLDIIYGPMAKPLRAKVASILCEREIKPSHPEAQFGRLRKRLLAEADVTGNCIATEDEAFEKVAEGIVLSALNCPSGGGTVEQV